MSPPKFGERPEEIRAREAFRHFDPEPHKNEEKITLAQLARRLKAGQERFAEVLENIQHK